VAKKEMRRAARQAQRQKAESRAQDRRDRRPSWKRSVITAAILAALWLALSRFLTRGDERPIITDIIWAALFFIFYVGFVYFWESFLYRRRLRRRAGSDRK
jgi:fatty acid desaturase